MFHLVHLDFDLGPYKSLPFDQDHFHISKHVYILKIFHKVFKIYLTSKATEVPLEVKTLGPCISKF